MNVGLFPGARVHDFQAIYVDDLWIDRPAEGFDLSPNIKLIETPGHTPQDLTTLVTTDAGVVAFTHLWWAADGPADDPYTPDADLFMRTARACWVWSFEIVPGHGPRFVPDETHPTLSREQAMTPPKLILILSENWTMTSPRDLPSLVRFAVEAEQAGFDAVMVSEHVVLGPGADSDGLPSNPRDYALPGNQDPTTPWPSSLVLLSAVAAVDHPAPAGGRRDHPAAPASAAVGEGPGNARSPVARDAWSCSRP